VLVTAPDADLVLAEWTSPGGEGFIAPLHVHHDDVELPAGSAVIVPRGTPHTYWNPTAQPTRYVLVMTRRIHDLIEALHAPGADIETTFREHRSEFLGWP
jgi:hypothetical protein